MVKRRVWLAGLSLALLTSIAEAPSAQEAETVLDERCVSCHQRTSDGGLDRVAAQRKTPEGWDMTIIRMMIVHGLEITADERRVLVKHLADTQGLAPSESSDFRYILERDPATFEEPPDEDLAVMCGRCHSFARVALQRRDVDEWLKLSHFHLGQYPTTEYQALGRDRNWWEIASTKVPEQLAELYPLETAAWNNWKDRPAPDLSGDWRFVGHDPGRGGYHGTMHLENTGEDSYDLTVTAAYDGGPEATGTGKGILYTGYEWRARITIGDDVSLQVFEVGPDGYTMAGRAFFEDQDSIGGRLRAVRLDPNDSAILAAVPPYLRAGESAEIAVHGYGLDGDVGFGEGVEIEEVVSATDQTIVVRASAAADAAIGRRFVNVGIKGASGLFTVYREIDRLSVEPAYNIARVGDADAPLPPVPAQFDAVAWLSGTDGEPGTNDDIRIGSMRAAWSVDNFDDTAAEMRDVDFTGQMLRDGLFMPAGAGPNPARPFSTNNAGNLAVTAVVEDGDRTVEGRGQLLVTVQRWNDPPIR